MRNLSYYFRPASPEEAADLKRRYGARAAYLAGGSDLLVHKPRQVEAVVDIRHADMAGWNQTDDAWVIGGAALLREVELGLGHVAGGLLGSAVRETAPWLIRNAATLAGNIANASPAADSVPALLALDAELLLLGTRAERVLLGDVLIGPHRTALGDRLIREIVIPRVPGRTGVFIKMARSKSDIALVNLAVTGTRHGDVLREIRIALGAVAPTAVRARRAEALLEGQPLTAELLQQAADTVQQEISPISDWRSSADYRRRMSAVLLRRALGRIVKESESET